MPDKQIYDRTAAAVARVNELMRKVRAGSATDAEREEWLGGGMKGAWNASDLNRINDWLAYLTDFLEAQVIQQPFFCGTLRGQKLISQRGTTLTESAAA